ncbi:hypothetical protein [Roseovarius aestuariivivens]|uniref:hypothetical protein n=1 Tax=Roseovarius aestuariivivens TaxID=1888910 RepID=UPI001080E4B1|nr:hypothetical protein [Roseovarius aestuariivivens]
MSEQLIAPRPVWGLAGFVAGAVALVIVVLQISAVFAEPPGNPGTAIGEIAAEIKKSAVRSLLGQPQPEPEVEPWNIMDYLSFAAPILAGLAAIAGAVGLFRRETPQLPVIAIGFGAGAFVMQYAFWLALLIGGICILVAILNNIGDIFGGWGDMFSG